MPTAVTTVAMVKPCFLKSSFKRSLRVLNLIVARSRRGSLSTSCSLSCSSWFFSRSIPAFLSVSCLTFLRARSRTTGSSFLLSATCWCSSSCLLISWRVSTVSSISWAFCWSPSKGSRADLISFGSLWLKVFSVSPLFLCKEDAIYLYASF